MKKRFLFLFLISGLVLMNGCQREYSLESGNTPSEGSLQDDGAGDCLPKTVAGAYVVNVALVGATNYIEVQVNVTKTGSYTIYTDTVNGMYFRGSGAFTATGLFTVQLKGNGTPLTTGISNFIVTYGTSGCTIAVTTVGSLAVFTLDGAPGGCMGAAVAGTYTAGTILTASNNVTINVNVTTIGAYSITTTLSNGMTFSGSGVFAVTGAQAIVLIGSGTPAAGGNTNIPVSVGSSSCSFPVNVGAAAGAATFTINCATPATINGTYTVGTALNPATNTIGITVDVTTPGTYTITGTINNMTFNASGTFAATGAGQNVTLVGTGNPNTPNANIVPLIGGTAPCNITVNVNPAAPGVAVFTVNCTPAPVVSGTYTQSTTLVASNTVTINVNVTTIGTYSISTTVVNGMTFSSAPGSSFTITGGQSVILTGSGTPVAAGTFFIPVPSAACNFLVIVATTSTDYFPRVTNNNWSYELDNDATDSVYRKAISPTFTALGNTYNIFMHDDGSGLDSSGYYRKNGGDYFEYLDVGSFLTYDDPLRAEYIMLKDNVPAGPTSTWKSAGFTGTITIPPPQSLTLRFSYTILQKDDPITVVTSMGSITYQNVIVVEEKYEQFTGGIWVDITSLIDFYGKSYYARGIGLIKYESLDASNAVTFVQELRRYVVY
jgi:hypothetical protein